MPYFLFPIDEESNDLWSILGLWKKITKFYFFICKIQDKCHHRAPWGIYKLQFYYIVNTQENHITELLKPSFRTGEAISNPSILEIPEFPVALVALKKCYGPPDYGTR